MKKTSLFPTNIIDIFGKNCYNVILYQKDEYKFPKYAYTMVLYYLILTSALDFLDSHEGKTGIHSLELFIHLFATPVSIKWGRLLFFIYFILFLVFIAFITLVGLYYSKRQVLPLKVTKFTLFISELLSPIIMQTIGSKVGNDFYLFVENKDFKQLGYALVTSFLNIMLIIYFTNILYNEVSWNEGRCFTYTSEQSFSFFIFLFVIRSLSRSYSLFETDQRFIISIVSIIILTIFVFYSVTNNIFVYSNITRMCGSLLTGSIVNLIVSNFVYLDWVLRICILLVSALIANILIGLILNSRKVKMIALLDNLICEETTFIDAFPRLNYYFYNVIYEGLQNGHPYVISCKIFEEASEIFIINAKFWKAYTKVLAIYESQTNYLREVAGKIEGIYKYKNHRMDLFLISVNSIIEKRSTTATKECKTLLKRIKKETENLKDVLVKYWLAIQRSNNNNCLKLCDTANSEIHKIRALYDQALRNWPKVKLVYESYSLFLNNICCDKNKSKRVMEIYEGTYKNDKAEISAMNMFINLPKESPNYNSEIIKIEKTESGFQMNLIYDFDNSEEESQFFIDNWEKTPIRINTIIIFSFLILIVILIAGMVSISTTCLIKFRKYKNILGIEEKFVTLSTCMAQISSDIIVIGLQNIGLWNKDEKIYEIIGSASDVHEKYIDVLYNIPKISESIDYIIKSRFEITDSLKEISRSIRNDIFIQNVTLKMNSEKAKTIFLEALNMFVSHIYSFSSSLVTSGADVTKESWYLYPLENNFQISLKLFEFTKRIAMSLVDYINNIAKDIKSISIIFIIISILYCPVIFYNFYVQNNQYISIVNSFSKLPSIAIINKIISLKGENTSEDSIQIKDSKGDLTPKLISIVLFSITIYITTNVGYHIAIQKRFDIFKAIPYQIENLAQLMFMLYDNVDITARIHALNKGFPQGTDGPFLYFGYIEGTELIYNLANNVFFGQEDGIKYGYLTIPSKNSNNLLSSIGDINLSDIHSIYENSAPIVSLEILQSEMNYFSKELDNPEIFNKDSVRINHLAHFEKSHFAYQIINQTIVNGIKNADSTIETTLINLIIIIASVIIFGITVAILFVCFQNKVVSSVRFMIMSLGMLDQKYLQSSYQIMEIASGNFTVKSTSESISSHYVNFIKDYTDDAIINTDYAFELISYNKETKKLPNFTHSAKSIKDFMEIPKEAYELRNSNKLKSVSLSKEYTDSKGKCYTLEITITKCNNETLYFIFHREMKLELLNLEKKKINKAISEAYNAIIPKDLKENFKENPHKLVNYKNVLVVLCRQINFTINNNSNNDNEFEIPTKENKEENDTEKELINEVINLRDKFKETVEASAASVDDCLIIYSHNATIYAMFNGVKKEEKLDNAIREAEKFIKKVHNDCKSQGIDSSFVLSRLDNLVIGSLSKFNSAFNIYSKDINAYYALSRMSQDGEIYIKDVGKSFPNSVKESIEKVSLDFIDEVGKIAINNFNL